MSAQESSLEALENVELNIAELKDSMNMLSKDLEEKQRIYNVADDRQKVAISEEGMRLKANLAEHQMRLQALNELHSKLITTRLDAEFTKMRSQLKIVLQRCGNIVILCESVKRQLPPVENFSELLDQVTSWNPGYECALQTEDGFAVASQYELVKAYESLPENAIGNLRLRLHRIQCKVSISRKRKSEVSSSGDDKNNSSRWTMEEIIRFETAVKKFGWGDWSSIAAFLQTRNPHAVRAFSKTARAQFFRSQPTTAFENLAESLKNLSGSLKREIHEEKVPVDHDPADELHELLDASP